MSKYQKVKCNICNNEYSIKGIATHLKDTHKLTVDQYVKTYGEYRPLQLDYKTRALKNKIECKVCGELFGSERLLSYHLKKIHKLQKEEYVIKYIFDDNHPKCKCGCNREVKLLMQYPYRRDYVNSGCTPNSMLGKVHLEESKQLMRDKAIERIGQSNKVNTSLELEFENFLLTNNIEYLKQVPTDYGCIDFYLVEQDIYVEIDGEYWHPTNYENLNFQQLSSTISDKRKSRLDKLIRIRGNDVNNIKKLSDLEKYNYTYTFDINYRQVIINKEYIKQHKRAYKYDWLLLKFLREFNPDFPYPTSSNQLNDIINTIPTKLISFEDNSIFNNKCSNVGVEYLKSIFKSYWNSKYKQNKSPIEIWNDDKKMKNIILYRLSKEPHNFSLHQMIRGISAIRGTISFFKPILASSIYKEFLKDKKNPIVIDPCSGFGGRLLGFKSLYPNGTYIGIEPNIDTYNELLVLKDNLIKELNCNEQTIQIYNTTSEEFIKNNPTINCDLTFTSIPYYDKEIYSNHVYYNSIEEWCDKFLTNGIHIYPNKVINFSEDIRQYFPKQGVEYKLINNTSHFNTNINSKIEYILKY